MKSKAFTGSTNNLKMLATGRHPSQIQISCLQCRKVTDAGNYARSHGSKCKGPSKYTRNKDHIKVYTKHFGSIPLDSNGRVMEVHHIDNDHNNNVITNLKLVTIDEHYAIHYAQKDWAACQAIKLRMDLTADEISALASKAARARVTAGTHNFLGPNSPTQKAWTCPHCNKSGKGQGSYNHHHGDNCKSLKILPSL